MYINCDVVIVDSGYWSENSEINSNIIGGISIEHKKDGDIIYSDEYADYIGHGTAITNIICKNKTSITCYIIRVFKEKLNCDGEVLYAALQFITRNISCKWVNLSLGVLISENIERLWKICTELRNRRIILIAAFENRGTISYPAAFEEVIGVGINERCINKENFIYVENSKINILGKGNYQRVKWKDKLVPIWGSSFATANITALLCENSIYGEIDEVKHFLKNNAMEILRMEPEKEIKRCPKIKKAIALPFNKEIRTLAAFSDLLTFRLIGIYDIKLSCNVGRKYKLYDNENIVEDIKSIVWEEDFDAIIVGHIQKLEYISGRNIWKYILEKAQQFNKTIIAFDKEYMNYDKVYVPYVGIDNVQNQEFDKLFLCGTPVVGVFGTSSNQGKYTTQLLLRRLFKKNGYIVGQIGTEPSSELFGFDEVFPIGYNQNIELEGYKSILYLNKTIRRIERKAPDIIIGGSQSGTSIFWKGNLKQYPVKQLDFLMGILPDAIILCVNYFDSIEFINRTRNVIEGLCGGKVIAMCVYPFRYKENWDALIGNQIRCSKEEVDEFKKRIGREFSVPCYDISLEMDQKELFMRCIEFF